MRPIIRKLLLAGTYRDPLANIPFVLRLQTQQGKRPKLGTQVDPGASVTTWTDDLSGSGLKATGVGGSTPTLAISNGKRAVSFNTQTFTLPTITTNGLHFFATLRVGNATLNRGIIATNAAPFNTFIELSGVSGVRVRTESNTLVALTFPKAVTVNQWFVLEVTISGGVASCWVNGIAGTTGAVTGDVCKFSKIGTAFSSPYIGEMGALMIHEGVLANPDRDRVRAALDEWITKNYYVANSGSDSNDGWSEATPWATLAKASAVNLWPGDSMNLRCGDAWREVFVPNHPWTTVDVVRYQSYGTGPKPDIMGSQLATGWALVTGTEYKAALAYTAVNAFWITAIPIVEATISKLLLGTAGSLTVGQFGTSSGFVHVNIGSDPTTARIEVPRAGVVGWALANISNTLVRGIRTLFHELSGVTAGNGTNNTFFGCDISWNGDDGVSPAGSGQMDVLFCNVIRNGRVRQVSGGAGDGISFHGTFRSRIVGNVVRDNEKGGVTNLQGCVVQVIGNLIDHNNQNAYILFDAANAGGAQLWQHNLIVIRSDDAQEGIRMDGGATAILTAYNNTIIQVAANHTGNGILGTAAAIAKNNIITGFGVGINTAATADHNCVYSCTTAYSGVTAGSGSITNDPLFVGSGDYSLQTGSPCKGTGSGLGLTEGYQGVPPPIPANIGAI